jgi:hypothetical protein
MRLGRPGRRLKLAATSKGNQSGRPPWGYEHQVANMKTIQHTVTVALAGCPDRHDRRSPACDCSGTAGLERRLRAEQNEFFLDAGATNLEN